MKKTVVIILLVFALLFVLAGIAGTLFFAFGKGTVAFNRPPIHATAEETKTLNTNGPLTLKIHDDAGKVTVTGGEGKKMTVQVVKTGSAFTQADAEKELKKIQYEVKQDGNTITLTYKLDNLNLGDAINMVDFIVTVPSETTVDVEAQLGDISISGTNGVVNVVGKFGEVTVRNIEGKVTVDTDSGQVNASAVDAGNENIELSSGFGKVSLEKASGKDLRLDSQSGALEMTNVNASGDVDMSTNFGDTNFTSGSANLLNIKTSSGKVTLSTLNLSGALTAKSEFGEIDLEQVKATSYDLQTNSGSITVDGASGNVKAHSGFGSVTVKNADAVTLDLNTQSGSVKFEGSLGDGPHTVHTDFGEINLTIPADSALKVDLKTDFGKITSEIPITIVLSGDLENSHQTGTMNGGGDLLTVETQSGDISIQADK